MLLSCKCASFRYKIVDKLINSSCTRADMSVPEACLIPVYQEKNVLLLCLLIVSTGEARTSSCAYDTTLNVLSSFHPCSSTLGFIQEISFKLLIARIEVLKPLKHVLIGRLERLQVLRPCLKLGSCCHDISGHFVKQLVQNGSYCVVGVPWEDFESGM